MSEEAKFSIDQAGMWGRIKETLDAKNAREVSEITGVTKQSAHDWQRGKTPSLEMLLTIASHGDVSLHWLVTGKGHRKATLLTKKQLSAIEKLAVDNGVTSEEQIAKFVEESLVNLDVLENSRSKTLQKFLRMFEEIETSERSTVADYLIREIISKSKNK